MDYSRYEASKYTSFVSHEALIMNGKKMVP